MFEGGIFIESPLRSKTLLKALEGFEREKKSKIEESSKSKDVKKVSIPSFEQLSFQILVVDDNPVNLKVAKRLLQRLGIEADVVSSGAEAVECAMDYDLIFMDLQMPNMGGVEATRKIQTKLGKSSPKIVALTADTREETVVECRSVGMVKVLNKPVRIKELADIISCYS